MAKTKKPAQFIIQNCTFTSQPEDIEAVRLRAEAIKAAASALEKVAEAVRGNAQTAPLLVVNDKP